MNGESNRISAATGMFLNNHRIGKRLSPDRPSSSSESIHDTLETTDSPTGQQLFPPADVDETEKIGPSDSVSPGDVLDISG